MILKILITFLIVSCECSRILFINPTYSRSHVSPLQILAKLLANPGHEVTFVSSFKLDEEIENYRDMQIDVSHENLFNFNAFSKVMSEANAFGVMSVGTQTLYSLGNETLQSPMMKKLMKTENFDLDVVGWFTNNFLIGLADHFKCPLIVFTSGNMFSMLYQMVGNPLAPDGAAHGMSGTKEVKTFKQRLGNYLGYVFDVLIVRSY